MIPINYTIRRTPENPLGKTDTIEVRSAKAANRDGNYARGYHIGANVDYSFGDGWKIANKFRYQSYNHGTKFNLGVSPYYTDANASNVRVLIDGDGVDADLMDEFRLEKDLKMGGTKHHISAGIYHSTGNYKADTWSLTGWTPADRNLIGFKGFAPPSFRASSAGGPSRNDKYTVNTNAVFIGGEMAIGSKLKITVGFRYGAINMNMYGFYRDTIKNGQYVTMNRKENYADWTASIGGNYLIDQRTAIYGNFTRAYRMPDYGAFTPLRKAQVDPTNAGYTKSISNNEIVYNSELGFRSGFGDFNFDVSAFYTFIDNRLATVYEGAVAVLRPLGNNDIRGAEIALSYAPQAVKGLNLSTFLTVQNAIFQSFLIPVRTIQSANPDSIFGLTLVNQQTDGTKKPVYAIDLKEKQLPRVPSQIFNASASYDSKYWGFDASVNANMNIYNDATNLYKANNITWINMGLYGRYPLPKGQSMRLSISVKNLLNTDYAERNVYGTSDDSALNQRQLVARGLDASKVYYNGIPVMPRRFLVTLDYKF